MTGTGSPVQIYKALPCPLRKKGGKKDKKGGDSGKKSKPAKKFFKASVLCVAFHPSSNLVATGSADRCFKVFTCYKKPSTEEFLEELVEKENEDFKK